MAVRASARGSANCAHVAVAVAVALGAGVAHATYTRFSRWPNFQNRDPYRSSRNP